MAAASQQTLHTKHEEDELMFASVPITLTAVILFVPDDFRRGDGFPAEWSYAILERLERQGRVLSIRGTDSSRYLREYRRR
jgi:hypothetical protein